MALDPNIAMGFKGFQLNDPMDNYAKAASLSQMGMQNQYMQTKMDESRRLSDLAKMRQQIYAASGGDSEKLLAGLQQAGDMEGVQAFQDHLLSQQKSRADIDHKTSETNARLQKLVSGVASMIHDGGSAEHALHGAQLLRQYGANAQADIVEDWLEKNPNPTPQMIQKAVRPYIASEIDAKTMLTPNMEMAGDRLVNTNPFVNAPDVKMGASPDTVMREAGDDRRLAAKERGDNARLDRQRASNPYFQFLPTAEGYQVGNARTGEISSPPNAVIPATADPVLQGRIAGARTGGEVQAKRDHNMKGLGDTIREAELILSGQTPDGKKAPLPTGSGIGTGVDIGAGFFGISPDGSEQAQQLKAISGALTSKMPRMEGPQSDKDVQMYKEMAALIGDSMVPLPRRKAALLTVKRLWGKYEKKGGESAAPNIDSLLEKYK